jgi:3alpha(or 20beta)-hydroxysteroid dehydrogenase
MSGPLFDSRAFAGRVYGVTGAAHGIGEATTRLLVSLGAHILAMDKDATNIDRVKREVEANSTWLCTDVSDDEKVGAAIEQVAAEKGRIDGWVNNAMYATRGMIDQQPEEQMNAAWRVNVLTPWRIARRLIPHFKRVGGGSIVNISSIHAHESAPGASAYVSTKAALEGLTRAMAVELAPLRIRVNSVVPGFILTYAGTASRLADRTVAAKEEALRNRIEEIEGRAHQPWPINGLPGDVANLIAFLLSDASAFITGAAIPIDGGLSADVRCANEKVARAHEEMEECRRQLANLGLPPNVTY